MNIPNFFFAALKGVKKKKITFEDAHKTVNMSSLGGNEKCYTSIENFFLFFSRMCFTLFFDKIATNPPKKKDICVGPPFIFP